MANQTNLIVKALNAYMERSKGKTAEAIALDFANATAFEYESLRKVNNGFWGPGIMASLTTFIASQTQAYVQSLDKNGQKKTASDTSLSEDVDKLNQAVIKGDLTNALLLLDLVPKSALAWVYDKTVDKRTDSAQNLIKTIFLFTRIAGIAMNSYIYTVPMAAAQIDTEFVFGSLDKVAKQYLQEMGNINAVIVTGVTEPRLLRSETQGPITRINSRGSDVSAETMAVPETTFDPTIILEQYFSRASENLSTSFALDIAKFGSYVASLHDDLIHLEQLKIMQWYVEDSGSFENFLQMMAVDAKIRKDFEFILDACHPRVATKLRKCIDNSIKPNTQKIFLALLQSQLHHFAKKIIAHPQNAALDDTRYVEQSLVNSSQGEIHALLEKTVILTDLCDLKTKIDELIGPNKITTWRLPNWWIFNFLLPKSALIAELKQCKMALEWASAAAGKPVDLKNIVNVITRIKLSDSSRKKYRLHRQELKQALTFFPSNAHDKSDDEETDTNQLESSTSYKSQQ